MIVKILITRRKGYTGLKEIKLLKIY